MRAAQAKKKTRAEVVVRIYVQVVLTGGLPAEGALEGAFVELSIVGLRGQQ